MKKTKYKDTNKSIIINDDDGSLILSDEIIKKANQLITGKHKINAIEQKVFHLRNERLINSPIMFVPFDALKSQIAMPSSGDILVDDTITNIYDWELYGGCPYLFNNPDIEYYNKVRSLEFLLKK